MNNGWSGVLLAGVHDWGACALNKARLRPLVPVANRLMIEHVLRSITNVGIERAAICANGHSDIVREAVGDSFADRLRLQYVDDTMPRGPAGCVKDAAAGWGDGNILVVEASVLPCFDMSVMLQNHVRSGAALTIATQRRSTGSDASYVPVGVYAIATAALSHVRDKGFRDIKEGLIPVLHDAGLRVDVHTIDGVAPRLQGISSYFAMNDWAVRLAGGGAWELDGYSMESSSILHMNARVDTSAKLLGPVIVGPGAVVRSGAIVVGPTTIGRDCEIGTGSVVSRSAIWDGGSVGLGAQVDRCVVADGASVPANARYENEVRLATDADHRHRSNRANRVEAKVTGEWNSDGLDPIVVESGQPSEP